jgi:chromate transporter
VSNIFWESFKTFFKIGMFTLGGGYAMIPLIEEEVVNRHRWIDRKEMLDLIAIAQSCPGVFAINISIFVGYKLNKVRGAVATALGTALPSFLIILAIAIFFHQFEDNRVIAAMFKGIRPAVVALIAVPTFNLAKRAQLNWFTIWIPVVSALLIWLLGVSPIWIIIAAGVGGYIYGKVTPSSVPEGTTNADKDDNSNKKAPSGAVGG